MTKLTYASYHFYSLGLLRIVGIQTDNTLILANNNFTSMEEKAVKNGKIITKDWEYLTSAQSIKFNGAQMKLDSNGIVLIKESYVSGILPLIKHDADFTSSKEIIKKKNSHLRNSIQSKE